MMLPLPPSALFTLLTMAFASTVPTLLSRYCPQSFFHMLRLPVATRRPPFSLKMKCALTSTVSNVAVAPLSMRREYRVLS